MAVEYDGGVVLGADSRTSTGSYIANRVSDKITYVSDSIYVCRSGSAADTQAIADILRMYLGMHRWLPLEFHIPNFLEPHQPVSKTSLRCLLLKETSVPSRGVPPAAAITICSLLCSSITCLVRLSDLTPVPRNSLEQGGQPETPVAANILNQLCYGNKNNLMAGMICAGWYPALSFPRKSHHPEPHKHGLFSG